MGRPRLVYPDGYLKCHVCGILKLKEEFHKNKSTNTGFQSKCILCVKEWYRENKENQNARTKNWADKNKDRLNELQRQWYVRNREYKLERDRQWSIDNRDKKAMYTRRRRLRNSLATGFYTEQQLKARMDYHGNKCVYCNGKFESVEHMIPLSRGGTNWPSNLVPSCNMCNSRKNTKTYLEFMKVKDKYD